MDLSAPILTAAIALSGNCWVDTGNIYGIPSHLLYAMGQVESSLNPSAIAHANNGTHSIGIMQINSSWFPELQEAGITEDQLYDPCTNIRVGGWILAQEIERYGYSWEAIGAYYAGSYTEKDRHWKIKHYKEYSQKVITRWQKNLEKLNRPKKTTVASNG